MYAMVSIDLAWVRKVTPQQRETIREQARISREMMARDIGCGSSVIFRYEKGHREPTGRTGADYARLLRKIKEATE